MALSNTERTEAAEKLARLIKREKLRRLPGMDDVAVALNSGPTYEEAMQMKNILMILEEKLGYDITKKG